MLHPGLETRAKKETPLPTDLSRKTTALGCIHYQPHTLSAQIGCRRWWLRLRSPQRPRQLALPVTDTGDAPFVLQSYALWREMRIWMPPSTSRRWKGGHAPRSALRLRHHSAEGGRSVAGHPLLRQRLGRRGRGRGPRERGAGGPHQPDYNPGSRPVHDVPRASHRDRGGSIHGCSCWRKTESDCSRMSVSEAVREGNLRATRG